MFMPILMKTWLNEHGDHAHGQQFAQAIARLAGNSDSGEQHHGIKRDHDHAAHESFLLGNDGENEIVMRHGARQIAQRVLGSLAPAFANQPAGADGDQRLVDVVGIIALLRARASARSAGVALGGAKSRPK